MKPHTIQEPDQHRSTPFEQLGGEEKIQELVDRFYDLMDLEPQYKLLRDTHGDSLDVARDKLFDFLCGWLGGPPYFEQKYGHPRLRARHLPFSIGTAERDQWLACMFQAMTELQVDANLQKQLEASFYRTADWMRNREG